MKYCQYCGKQIADDADLCPYCGNSTQAASAPQVPPSAPTYPNQQYPYGNVPHTPRQSNTNLIIIILSVALVVIVAIVAMFFIFSGSNRSAEEEPAAAETIRVVEEVHRKAPPAPAPAPAPRVVSNLSRFASGGSYHEYYMGDNWRSEVGSALSGAVFINGGGSVGRGSVRLNLALLKNGSIVGRNYHSSGASLDVNGYVDQYGSLHLQLGHGSETSWYNLSPSGASGNTFYYKGTWSTGSNSASCNWTLTAQ